jgi:hypothetical protein
MLNLTPLFIIFHENSFSCSPLVICGQTDRDREADSRIHSSSLRKHKKKLLRSNLIYSVILMRSLEIYLIDLSMQGQNGKNSAFEILLEALEEVSTHTWNSIRRGSYWSVSYSNDLSLSGSVAFTWRLPGSWMLLWTLYTFHESISYPPAQRSELQPNVVTGNGKCERNIETPFLYSLFMQVLTYSLHVSTYP